MLQVLIWVIVLLVHWIFIYTYCDIVNQEKGRIAHENEQLKQEVAQLEETVRMLQGEPQPPGSSTSGHHIPRA